MEWRWWEEVQESVILSPKTKTFNNPPHSHTLRAQSSELVMVLGEVFSVVGGLTSHKHVPVFEDLLLGQHLVLRRKDKGSET